MNLKIIKIKAIKFVPTSFLKVHLLRYFFGFSIGKNVKIGKVIFNCKMVTIGDNVYIADNNVFSCNNLTIGANTAIHSGNVVQGAQNFSVGRNSRIINNHFFDVWNSIYIGDNTWIAGKNSQFWTHGSIHTKQGIKDLSIAIKDDVYVGSSCLFSPGTIVDSLNLVGLGSVVSGEFNVNNCIIAGNPATVVKNNIVWRENW